MIVATVYFNTEADGSPVDPSTSLEDGPKCYYGPFDTEAEAARWLTEVYPDGDTDVADDAVQVLDLDPEIVNSPTIFDD